MPVLKNRGWGALVSRNRDLLNRSSPLVLVDGWHLGLSPHVGPYSKFHEVSPGRATGIAGTGVDSTVAATGAAVAAAVEVTMAGFGTIGGSVRCCQYETAMPR